MSSNVTIVGEVSYREGDGPMMLIRPGLCELELTAADATLGWQDGDDRLSAVMPRSDFEGYVKKGAIRLEAGQA
ncbi:MAG: hypothetical protein IV092_12860 [Burkholderiaceae bacterium]|nr:hypothetical protein [Burkholderiaceae bacterium]MBT9502132.1 hypothetical protein [Burkholderiaceae bacterium]